MKKFKNLDAFIHEYQQEGMLPSQAKAALKELVMGCVPMERWEAYKEDKGFNEARSTILKNLEEVFR